MLERIVPFMRALRRTRTIGGRSNSCPLRLLGRHVSRGSGNAGEAAPCTSQFGNQPIVEDDDSAVGGGQHILRLQVAMDNALGVQRHHRGGQLRQGRPYWNPASISGMAQSELAPSIDDIAGYVAVTSVGPVGLRRRAAQARDPPKRIYPGLAALPKCARMRERAPQRG